MAVHVYWGRRGDAQRVYGGDLLLLRRHIDATNLSAVYSGLFPGGEGDQLGPAAVILTDADEAEFRARWFQHADSVQIKFDRYLRARAGVDITGQPFTYIDCSQVQATASPWAEYGRPGEVLVASRRLTERYGRRSGREAASFLGSGTRRVTLILIGLLVAGFLAVAAAGRPAALAGVIPAGLWMLYLRRKDRVRPESRAVLGRAALVGVVATLPAILVEALLSLVAPSQLTPLGAIVAAFVVAAGVEESGKALCLWSFRWNPEFDERFDGIVYAGWIGLAFAAVENVLYLAAAPTSGAYVATFVLRAVLAVPNHAIWAGLVGYSVARWRFGDPGANPPAALALAITLHGLYDAGPLLSIALGHENVAPVAVRGALGLLGPVAVTLFGMALISRRARAALAADEAEAQVRAVRPPGPRGAVGGSGYAVDES